MFAPSWSDARFDAVREAMRARGVDVRPFWKPIHLQAPYRAAPKQPLPVSEAIWSKIAPLPCSTGLSDPDLETTISAFLDAAREHSA